MQIDAWSLQGVLLPLNASRWKHDGYFILLKQCTCEISNKLMSEVYPRGNENDRERSSLLLKSGALQWCTMKCTHCKSRLDENLDTFLLRIDCTPSIKSKVSNESIKSKIDEMHDH